MKKILLIDSSVTVQKVVSLTLDKTQFDLRFAKNRTEAMQNLFEFKPQLVFVSDQMQDISAQTFPKEAEVWLSQKGIAILPPMVMISSQENAQPKNYTAVLKKPFTPQALQVLIADQLRAKESSFNETHNQFNETFNDEAAMMSETFQVPSEPEKPEDTWVGPEPVASSAQLPSNSSLWNQQTTEPPRAKENVKVEHLKVEQDLKTNELQKVVENTLNKILPAIVEKMVKERLDSLLKEQETFLEIKP
jgi:CheY-like chemotaxis protein